MTPALQMSTSMPYPAAVPAAVGDCRASTSGAAHAADARVCVCVRGEGGTGCRPRTQVLRRAGECVHERGVRSTPGHACTATPVSVCMLGYVGERARVSVCVRLCVRACVRGGEGGERTARPHQSQLSSRCTGRRHCPKHGATKCSPVSSPCAARTAAHSRGAHMNTPARTDAPRSGSASTRRPP